MADPATAGVSGRRPPSTAAYTRADVEDARRGYPAVDLTDYGRARGLEPMGQILIGHVAGLNPLWTDYVFNVLRGELAPGRFGTVQHELDEIGLGDDGDPTQPGEYHKRRSVIRPGLGSLIGWHRDPPNEPFAAQAMWLPTTGIKVLVPEAALLPRIVATSATYSVLSDRSLKPWAPSYRIASSRWVNDTVREAVAAAIGPQLQALGTTYARLELAHGALGLVVDGYRHDPADLDRLVAAVVAMAGQLAEVARPWCVEGGLAGPTWAFDRSTHPPGYRSFDRDHERSGMVAMDRAAAQLSMTVEDPVALHRRAPRLPLPGTSMGMLYGVLPGGTVPARLTWQTQSHPGSSAYLRRAAVVAVGPGSPALPVGGVLVPQTDMYVASADGVAACWTRSNSPGRLDAEETAALAVTTFRSVGITI